MPLAGFTCPPGTPTVGTRNTIDHCLTGCPHPCLATPLLLAIWEAEHANHHQGAYISASMLSGSGCARQTVFERRHEFYEHPMRRYWAFRGTHAHSIIERGEDKLATMGWRQEMRMAVPLLYPEHRAPVFDAEGKFTGEFNPTEPLVITMGGTCDAYHPKKKELVDFKTMADIKADMMIRGTKGGEMNPHIDDKWVWQLNIYRWLIAKTAVPKDQAEQTGTKSKFWPAPTNLVIQGISMMSAPRTGATTTAKNKFKQLEDFAIPPVPVLTLGAIERYVRERAYTWYRYLILGETPPVVPQGDAWLCKSCPFNGELIAGERCKPNWERSYGTLPLDEDLETVNG